MSEAEELLARVRMLIQRVSLWSEWPDEASIGPVLTDVEKYLTSLVADAEAVAIAKEVGK